MRDTGFVGLRIRNTEKVQDKVVSIRLIAVNTLNLMWSRACSDKSFRVRSWATVLKYIWTMSVCLLVKVERLRRCNVARDTLYTTMHTIVTKLAPCVRQHHPVWKVHQSNVVRPKVDPDWEMFSQSFTFKMKGKLVCQWKTMPKCSYTISAYIKHECV